MFSKIVVALNELPESQRMLRTAIELARAGDADLTTVSIWAAFGVPYLTSHKKLPAVCSVCIEHLAQEQRGSSVEIGLGSEALRYE
jgi:Universal stress protein family